MDKQDDNYSNEVKKFRELILPTLELIFAKELPKDLQGEIEDTLAQINGPIMEYAQNVNELSKTSDLNQLAILSNELMEKLITANALKTSGLEDALAILFPKTKPAIDYIINSRYEEYIACLEEIIGKSMAQELSGINSYMATVERVSEDTIAWVQPLATDMRKIVKFLTHERIRFSSSLAKRCIREYWAMSGIFERLILVITGFMNVKPGKNPIYENIRKMGLSNAIKNVNKKGWSVITEDFDILLRNSIDHDSFHLNPHSRSVDFKNPVSGNAESITYRDMFIKTRALNCLILALSCFQGLYYKALLNKLLSSLKDT